MNTVGCTNLGNVVRTSWWRKIPGYEKRTINAAREHLNWAKENSGDNKIVSGILYIPSQNRIYVKELSSSFREYFNGIKSFRFGKSELISTMALTGLSANKALKRLIKETIPA